MHRGLSSCLAEPELMNWHKIIIALWLFNCFFIVWCDVPMQILVPEMDQVRVWVSTSDPDVLVLSETWLKKSVSNSSIHISGFHQGKGGGV